MARVSPIGLWITQVRLWVVGLGPVSTVEVLAGISVRSGVDATRDDVFPEPVGGEPQDQDPMAVRDRVAR